MTFHTELEGIPQELKTLRQWVAWWSVAGSGVPVTLPNGRPTRPLDARPKPHKLPVNAATGGLAMANNPATWTNFAQACGAVERFGVTGVGFVFAPDGPYTGIDLDDCREPATGAIAPWAQAILDELPSYTEVSPSGRGVKLIVRGTLPGGKGRRKKLEGGEIEMYSRDRYFTITGQRVAGMPHEIAESGPALRALYDRMFANAAPAPPPDRNTAPADFGSTRFERLWAGDLSDYDGDESRADLALCRVLARQTQNDPARIDALFRKSGLYREKWERTDYRDRTIALAMQAADTRSARKLTDVGNAERLIALHGHELRFCPELRSWLAWDGVRWNMDATACAIEYAKLTASSIHREAAHSEDTGMRAALHQWAGRSEAASRIFAMVRLAESDQRLRVSPSDLDSDPYLLNCTNGVVDLRTGELHPHDASYLLTRLCPVAYDPAARSPRWERFLEEVFAPHPDLVPFLQRAAGYSLTGETREECLFLLHGGGRNGKGVFLRTLTEILGDYAVTADFSTFTSQTDRGGPRDDVANMRGRHMVTAQEGREGAALAESLLKWLTGGDKVRARRLYENSYEFQPTHKIWLASNHKPAVRGADPAIWSRIKLVPFDVSFEGREDRTLKSAMQREHSGVLAWAVEGCLRWQEDGLAFPETVRNAVAAWRGENDSVGQFLEEHCITGEFACVKSRKLYAEYRRWAEEAGEEVMTERSFRERIVARGFARKHRHDGSWFLGLGLTADGS